MLRTYFLQKFRKVAPVLVVLQLLVLMVCLFFLQWQHRQITNLQSQVGNFIEEDNLQWEEVIESKLRFLKLRVHIEHRGQEHLDAAKRVLDLLTIYQDRLYAYNDSRKFSSNKIEELTGEFQKVLRVEMFESDVRYPDWSEMEKIIFYSESSSTRNKAKALNLQDSFRNELSSNLEFSIAENILLSHTQMAIDFLASKIFYGDEWSRKLEARIIPKAKNIQEGEAFEADIFLLPSFSMVRPKIIIDGYPISLDEDGTAQYRVKQDKLGKHILEGHIEWKRGDGKSEISPFRYEYTVLPKCN